jgi:hypothetical protein
MTNSSQPSLGERLSQSREEHATHEHEDVAERSWVTESDEQAPVGEKIEDGRSPATPLLLMGSVAAVVWTIAALVTLAALLIWWLV